MYHFHDRKDAGERLAKKLSAYKGEDVVVAALPRGGVVTAVEVAKFLQAPLVLVIPRKIGHPNQPEYALAAVCEKGEVVGDRKEISLVDKEWFAKEVARQRQEAKRRRLLYVGKREQVSLTGKTVIIIDDGIATGLTMAAAIQDVKRHNPKRIVVAVPVVAKRTAEKLRSEVDAVIALTEPESFFAIGAFYDNFPQVADDEVIKILKEINS